MSLEIANLVAKLTVELEGVQQGVNQMRQFTEQARAAGEVTEGTARKFDRMADATDRATEAHAKSVGGLRKVEEGFKAAGVTIDEARAKVRAFQDDLATAQRQAETGRVSVEQQRLLQGFVPQEVQEAAQLLGELDKAQGQVAKTGRRVRDSQERMGESFVRVRSEVDRARRPFREFLRSMLAINNGSIFTASGIASLVGRLTGLGLIAAGVIRGVQKLIRTFREGAAAVDAFTLASDGVAKVAMDFQALEDVDMSKLVGQLDDLSIRMKNLGATDPIGATQQVLEISADFQFLNATPDDLARTIQEVQRTVSTLDFSNLASFDLGNERVEDLNRKYQELAAQGLTQAELRTMALVDLERIRANQAGVAAERQADEEETLAFALGKAESALTRAFTENEKFIASVKGMADTIAAAQPTLDALATFFGGAFAFAIEKAIDIIDGFRVIWHATVTGAAQIWKGFLEVVSFGQIDTTGIDAFIDKQEAFIDQINALREIRVSPSLSAMRDVDQFANALGDVAAKGSLTIDFFEKLKRASGASVPEAAAATRAVLDQASALGIGASQVKLMEEQLQKYQDQMSEATDATNEFGASGVDAITAVKNELANVSAGAGVAAAVRQLGEASKELTEFGDAQAAFKFFEAYENALGVALDGGAEKLAAFRQFVEEQLQPQLSTQEYEVLIQSIDDTEAAFAGVDAEARRFQRANDGARGAVDNYADSAAAAADTTHDLGQEVVVATGYLDRMVANSPYDVEVRFSTSSIPSPASAEFPGSTTAAGTGILDAGGTGFPRSTTPDHLGGAFTDPTTTTPGSTTTTGARSTESRSNPLLEDKIATLQAQQDAADAAALRANAEKTVFAPRGGGGGGGGGSQLLDVEAIREFMQEVNRAIAIASREGVRIGTAGNAIPFEEGSFLNAQGGGLSVDQILIRGVWDFADPAAKRLIIRELQEALEALQAEV